MRKAPRSVLVGALLGCVALAACSGATDRRPAAGTSGSRAGQAGAQPSGSRPDVALTLAAPTGPHPTGTTLIHLIQPRTDPLNPKSGRRQLMVQLWYPTAPGARQPVAPYAPAGEVAALQKFYPVPAGAFNVRTHSRADAPVAAGQHKVIFFYPGLVGARTDSTAVAEQLASLGYVVVASASTGESSGVAFPDGRTVGLSNPAFAKVGADPFSKTGTATLERLLAVRVSDVRYIADELAAVNAGRNPDADRKPLPAGLPGSLVLRGMGMYGHSFGGGTAAAVVATDPRFAVGIDLDGFVIGPVGRTGTDKPFMMVGVDNHDAAFDPTWGTFIPKLTGWHRWFAVKNAGHYRFIDVGGSVTKWGLAQQIKPTDPATWSQVFGDIDDAQSQEIVRALVSGFFQKHLHGIAAPGLDTPTIISTLIINRTGQTT